jgi:2-dehydropantoate 2-reductase
MGLLTTHRQGQPLGISGAVAVAAAGKTRGKGFLVTRILIVGAGATGGYFGGRLVEAGRDVTFLVRPARYDFLSHRGLRITEAGETRTVDAPLITADEVKPDYDAVVLAVKAGGLDAAVSDVEGIVGPDTPVIPFLNGMAHLDRLNARFGRESVLGGSVRVVTKIDQYGDIVALAPGGSTVIGEQRGVGERGAGERGATEGAAGSARLHRLAEVFDRAGFDFATSDDIEGVMWQKWVFISTVNAITCLMRATIGEVVAVPGGVAFGTDVLAEAAAIAAAAGHPVPAAAIAATTSTITQEGSPFVPSMYRDLSEGLPVEVEHVLGDLVARAERLGVPAPLLNVATTNLRIQQNRL